MHTPVLIIGSGLAGLSTAYRLSKAGVPCTVVTKDTEVIGGCNSILAQGGLVYRSAKDSQQNLVEDILAAGDHINYLPAVEQLARDGVELVREILLDEIGVPVDRIGDKLSFIREAAHHCDRIIHVKDYTGRAIMESLFRYLEGSPLITFLRGHSLVDILTSGHHCRGYEYKYRSNRCLGAFLYDVNSHEVRTVFADHTVLCTGGIGQVYAYHTNAAHSYGSGLSAARRAKVRIINARFVQFHPTALWTPNLPDFREGQGRRFLISESLRGEGARLQDHDGRTFMDAYPQKDLESRAVVSRAIMEELHRSKKDYVYLNIHDYYKGDIPLPKRFPSIFKACKEVGIDMTCELIPVIPAEHFFCGGIYVNLDGQTELPGLFAAGEVACTGLHGANRLASTSLLECLTWGVKVADCILRESDPDPDLIRAFSFVEDWQSFNDKPSVLAEIELEKDKIRSLMWTHLGIIRNKECIFEAKEELHLIWKSIETRYAQSALSTELIELRHMAETANLITLSASSHTNLMEDSLGGHVLEQI